MEKQVLASSSVSIIDLNDGIDAYTILLTSEAYTISCNELGVPKPGQIGNSTSKAKTKIIVKKGEVELEAIGENDALDKNKFKYVIHTPTQNKTCLAKRINNNELYIEEVYADVGEVQILVYVESNDNEFYKTFTWNKSYDGGDSRYINLIGPSYFSYDNKADTTPTPSQIQLNCLLYGITEYSIAWEYKKIEDSIWTQVTNTAGSEINELSLTLNDKKLFGSSDMIEIKANVTDTISKKSYSAVKTITKIYGGFDSPYIKVSGEQFFKYNSIDDTVSKPSEITLIVDSYNINSPTYVWQYYDNGWKNIISKPGSLINTYTLTIDDKVLFGDKEQIKIRAYTTNLGDSINSEITITKIYNGKPAKYVKITGPSTIKYNDNIPEVETIQLTATQTNYKSPKYKWYKLKGSTFELIANTNNTLTLNTSDLADSNLFKVECIESNDSDISFDEFQVTKLYNGEAGPTLNVFIFEGTRNICYNGKNNLLTTNIKPFKIEVYKDDVNMVGTPNIKSITWGTNGHYQNPANVGSDTFIPIPLPKYDENKLDTTVSVVVNCDGRIVKSSVQIIVSKNVAGLDWVEEWDGSKVEIEDNYIIAPKLFAGAKNPMTGFITGLAIGQDILNFEDDIGMAIYSDSDLIGQISAKPKDGKVVSFGKQTGSRFTVDSSGFVVIEGDVRIAPHNKLPGTIGGMIDDAETAKEIAAQANKQVNEVRQSVTDLRAYSDGALKDGILTESEKEGYKASLKTLQAEKKDIDAQYESGRNNGSLSGGAWTNYKNAYDSYVTAYNNLITKINYIIALTTVPIPVLDRNDLNNKFDAHDNALAVYSQKLQDAMSAIAQNKADSAASNAINYITQREIFDKLTNNGSVQGIYMSNGQLYINGTYIQAGSISCERIGSSTTNPVIRLFEGNGLNCAIDASAYYSEGIGQAIRVKRDDNNYIYISSNNISFYCSGSNNNESALATFTGSTSNFKINSKGGNLELKGGVYYNGSRLAYASETGGSVSWGNITNKPSSFNPSWHSHSSGDISFSNSMTFGDVNTGSGSRWSYMGGYIETTGSCSASRFNTKSSYSAMVAQPAPMSLRSILPTDSIDGATNDNTTDTPKEPIKEPTYKKLAGSIDTSIISTVTPNLEYIGSDKVVNGVCKITIPPTVYGAGTTYNIQLTPIGNNPHIYVKEKNKDHFIVNGDDCEFDYIIKVRLPRIPDRLK